MSDRDALAVSGPTRMRAALAAVFEIHEPIRVAPPGTDMQRGPWTSIEVCKECQPRQMTWPCYEYKQITAALNGEPS
jgi:hypothetical protein